MTVRAAVVIPAAPLLIPALVGEDVARDEDLRREVRSAVDWLCDQAADASITVIGTGPSTGEVSGTWDLSGYGVPARGSHRDADSLPPSVGLGAYFLDERPCLSPRRFVTVAASASMEECAELGRAIAVGPTTALLVVGDGTARRDEKAPGHFDPRAAGWDERAMRALSDMDAAALLAADPAEARELWADGRAPWQVLAGVARSVPLHGRITVSDVRYGVQYVVGRWSSVA